MSLESQSPEVIAALAELSKSVIDNPETRPHFQKLLKKANPTIVVPELEAEERMQAAMQPHIEKIQEIEKQRQLEAAERAANDLYGSLRDTGAVSSRDDFGNLVKYASEKGFMTSEAGLQMASQHRRQEQQAAEPTPAPLGPLGGFNKESMKDWMKDPAGRARQEAAAALADIAKQKRAAH